MKHPSRRWRTGSRKRWWPMQLAKQGRSRSFTTTPMATGRAARRWMRWERCRQRCWKNDWVIDLDIQKFFDSVDHGTRRQGGEGQHRPAVGGAVCAAVAAPPRCSCPTVPCSERDRGTPQGSAVSPVLANLFLHYAFDVWMAREFPTVRFERYVDDAVVHCVSERQARQVLAALTGRMAEVGLQLHPDKTRIVYCQDGKRRHAFEHTSFTFLGYTFRPRGARAKNGSMFVSFSPAISKDALKKIGQEVRSWRLHRRTPQSFSELARWVNPIVRGWMQYYGAFYRSALYPLLTRINAYLMRWVRKKYRRFQGRREFQQAWQRVTTQYPRFFAHWVWTTAVPAVW